MANRTCLIIEDHLSSAQLYAKLLGVVDYQSYISTSYHQAIATLEEIVPDLIILDLRLAQRHRGEEILGLIKKDPLLTQTRVFIVTAYSTRAKELEKEVDLVIVKPINARQLIGTFAAIE